VNAPTGTLEAAAQRHRHDGWTPDRQRAFLEAVADGHSVEAAARSVGLSAASAYAFRRRAAGAAFALGWDGARLLARETVADALTQRVIDGQEERVTRPDGSEIVRFRYDNRLASTMLARLDRYADGVAATDAGRAARLAAQDFDAYLDLVSRDAGPARAALFLRARDPDGGGAAADGEAARAAAHAASHGGAALDPIAALARADLYARTGVGLASELDVSDLDPDQRARWTAEQWSRAEAAGLLTLGAAPTSQLSQLPQVERPDLGLDDPVWFDDDRCEWRTHFPPPDGAYVMEYGEYGDEDYERALTTAEACVMNNREDAELEERRILESAERDAWFLSQAMGPAWENPHEDDTWDDRAVDPPPSPRIVPSPQVVALPEDDVPCAQGSEAPGSLPVDAAPPDPPAAAPFLRPRSHAAPDDADPSFGEAAARDAASSLPPGGGTDASARRSCPTRTSGGEGETPWIRSL